MNVKNKIFSQTCNAVKITDLKLDAPRHQAFITGFVPLTFFVSQTVITALNSHKAG